MTHLATTHLSPLISLLVLLLFSGVAVAQENDSTSNRSTAIISPGSGEPVPVVEELSDAQIQELIAALGATGFVERDQAHQRLIAQGEPLLIRLDRITAAIEKLENDPEIAWRLKAIRSALTPQPLALSTWMLSYPDAAEDLKLNSKAVTFRDTHTISYDRNGNDPADNSEWSQTDSDQVTFSFNNRYAVYTGKRVSEKVFEGTAHNVKDKTWKWRLTAAE